MSTPSELTLLLESVARELAHEVRFSENFQPSAEVVLKRRLLPLLEAGQAMYDEPCTRTMVQWEKAWDAAKKAALEHP